MKATATIYEIDNVSNGVMLLRAVKNGSSLLNKVVVPSDISEFGVEHYQNRIIVKVAWKNPTGDRIEYIDCKRGVFKQYIKNGFKA